MTERLTRQTKGQILAQLARRERELESEVEMMTPSRESLRTRAELARVSRLIGKVQRIPTGKTKGVLT